MEQNDVPRKTQVSRSGAWVNCRLSDMKLGEEGRMFETDEDLPVRFERSDRFVLVERAEPMSDREGFSQAFVVFIPDGYTASELFSLYLEGELEASEGQEGCAINESQD